MPPCTVLAVDDIVPEEDILPRLDAELKKLFPAAGLKALAVRTIEVRPIEWHICPLDPALNPGVGITEGDD